MNSAWARSVAFYRRLPPSTAPIVLIILAVCLGNVMYLSGLAQNNPITWTANISHYLCRVACGRPAIDPNQGFITQPLGHLAAMDLLHGHFPWWNYFEGLGSPLAGEMQSAALFPLTLLFATSSGLLWFHICLQVIAGLSTYFLARRLSLPLTLATGAGIVFALNGTFAWLGNAVLNPVAFLPMLVLGVEMIIDSTRTGSHKGWYVAALALALSIYAGFPEVAYINGVFAGGWAVVRLFSLAREHRLVVAGRLALASVVGVLMALPILVPFYDFMKVAFIGSHTASQDGTLYLTPHALPMFFDPYVYGTIFTNPNALGLWGSVGGYFGASVTALALLGVVGARLRPLRIFLGAWSALGFAGIFNFLDTRKLWNLIPLVKTMAFARYIMPSLELSLLVLAVLGVMDFVHERRARVILALTTVVTLGIVTWSALEARSVNHGVILGHKARIIYIGLDLIPFLALAALLLLGQFPRAKAASLLISLVLVAEALLLFFVPTAQAPKQITVDQAPIAFLQANQGQERFLDFGVLIPNWGSQYGLNELSQIDLPFPQTFANFINVRLYPSFGYPLNQFTIHAGMTGIVGQEQALIDHFAAYQEASVKFLLMPNSIVPLSGLAKLGITRVFEDSLAAIYQMPTTPFFSADHGCTVKSTSFDAATVTCLATGATLVRSELWMDGWRATVNGKAATISAIDSTFQDVSVPAGTSTVTYGFTPPHEEYALVLGALALLFLVTSWVLDRSGIGRRRVRK